MVKKSDKINVSKDFPPNELLKKIVEYTDSKHGPNSTLLAFQYCIPKLVEEEVFVIENSNITLDKYTLLEIPCENWLIDYTVFLVDTIERSPNHDIAVFISIMRKRIKETIHYQAFATAMIIATYFLKKRSDYRSIAKCF